MSQIAPNLPDADPSASGVILSTRVYQSLCAIVNSINHLQVGGTLRMSKGFEGVTISDSVALGKVSFTITGPATTAEIYTGNASDGQLGGNITGNTASSWTANDLGNGTTQILVLNYAGYASSSGHSLPSGYPGSGWLIGYTSDGKQTPIVATNISTALPIPQYQGDVLQAVTQNTLGAGPVQFHPMVPAT